MQIPGLVSFYEEFEAMNGTNHTAESWAAIKPYERAEAVAAYRLRHFIELHESDAVAAHQKRKARQGKARQN